LIFSENVKKNPVFWVFLLECLLTLGKRELDDLNRVKTGKKFAGFRPKARVVENKNEKS